jgi:hypothetical protein
VILVDAARWSWRGRLWAHLVSDDSVDELHEFAHAIGKRRVGFQGDHYDVDTDERERAIAAGAVPVESRYLVRRLRESGLRLRGGLPSWTVLHDGPPDRPLGAVAGRHFDELADCRGLVSAVTKLSHATHLTLLRRPGQAAALLHATRLPERLDDLADLVDEVWVHREAVPVVELLQRSRD